MSVKYSVISKKDPRNPAAPPRYYASLRNRGRSNLRWVATRIGKISTVSSADTMATLEGLLTVIPEELRDGRIVELGELGTFRLSAKSDGAPDPGDITARSITGVKVIFTPGKLFKQALIGIKYQKE
ncbi:MAG: HU family DNA-binding protein [Anaerolineales bacterium]